MTTRQEIEEILEKREEEMALLAQKIKVLRCNLDQLPPDEPVLSSWLPGDGEWYWYINADGRATETTQTTRLYVTSARSYNYYRTREEAEMAAKRQRLNARLWQCYNEMYRGSDVEVKQGEDGWFIIRQPQGSYAALFLVHPEYVVGVPNFRSKPDAFRVIERLKGEGLL